MTETKQLITEASSVSAIKGVGEEMARKLARLKIASVGDLVNHWPRRFDDFSHVHAIAGITPGPVSLQVTFSAAKGRYVRRGLHITEAVASDASGSVKVVWFNQPYRAQHLKTNQAYYLVGELAFNRSQLSITNPSIELVSDMPANTARILPKYRETKGLNSQTLRKLLTAIRPYIAQWPENLPTWLVAQEGLVSHASALSCIHFPKSLEELSAAKKRLAFEEAFGLILASQLTRQERNQETAIAIPFDEQSTKKLVASLPFELTTGQRLVSWQILQEMSRATPMNRLVEGDVGSGKTVIAALTAFNAIRAKSQVLFIAPTELLARQHFATFTQLLGDLVPAKRMQLLVGATSAALKKEMKAALREHRIDLLIGTHALIEDSVELPNLGLVIVDEQHRFGVRQRQKLLAKAQHSPHMLSLTATPIPRSLALTLYGELDVSILRDKPKQRQPISTQIHSVNSRPQLYQLVEERLAKGEQAYIVCPIISQSDTVKHIGVEELYELVRKTLLPGRRVGILHGKLPAAEKDRVMQQFSEHKLDVLVATTVIEVGVDVPNATVMVIEGADAFGLAQLHQLRGRVGRGSIASTCYLVPSTSQAPSERLRAVVDSQDGFQLADLDLELRGPGQIYGTVQHGALDLRLVRLSDIELIESARLAADAFIKKSENLLDYPQLDNRIKAYQAITHLN